MGNKRGNRQGNKSVNNQSNNQSNNQFNNQANNQASQTMLLSSKVDDTKQVAGSNGGNGGSGSGGGSGSSRCMLISGVKLSKTATINLLQTFPNPFTSDEDKEAFGVDSFTVKQLFNDYAKGVTNVVRFIRSLPEVITITASSIDNNGDDKQENDCTSTTSPSVKFKLYLSHFLQDVNSNPAVLGYDLLIVSHTTTVIHSGGVLLKQADSGGLLDPSDNNAALLLYLKSNDLPSNIGVHLLTYNWH